MLGHQHHLSSKEKQAMLNGAGLGNMTQNLVGLSVIYGLNSVVETLSSQAYGSGKKKLCGVYLNRARLLLTLLYGPIAVILLHSEKILVFAGQDRMAASYC